MKLFRWFFTSALILLIVVFGTLMLLQSRWTKDQVAQVLQEMALQNGIRLTIGKIEGELPLKWTFTHVHAMLEKGDTIEIDRLQVRLALLPLLRKHFSVSYLYAHHTSITYLSSTTSQSTFIKAKGSFSLRAASFDEILVTNKANGEQMSYTLQGRGKYLRGGRSFFVEGELHSKDLDLTLVCEGSKKRDHVQTTLELAVKSQDAFAPFYKLPYPIAFEMKAKSKGSWQTARALVFAKESGPLHPMTGFINVHATPFELSSKFSLFADRSWALSHLNLFSPFAQLQGAAEIDPDGVPRTFNASVNLSDLSYFSKHLKGNATGALELQEGTCRLLLSTPEFTIDTTSFQQGKAQLLAHLQNGRWTAALEMEATHPTLGYHANSELAWEPKKALEIKSFDLISHIGRITGDLKNMQGGVAFQITDLAPLSPLLHLDLAGQIGGEIQFSGEEIQSNLLAKDLHIHQWNTHRLYLDLHHFAPQPGWHYNLQTAGDFDIISQGEIQYSSDTFQLVCDTLSGSILEKQIALQKKCTLKIAKDSFALEELDLRIDQGKLSLASSWDPTHATLQVHANHFPLDVLTLLTPRLSLNGFSSIDIDLRGTKEALTGQANLLLEHADIYPAGSSEPIQTKGTLQAHIEHNILQLHAHLVATDEQLCNISLTAPLRLDPDPLRITLLPEAPIAGQCTIEGHTEQLFDFINLGSQRVGGFLSCHLFLNGSLNDPIIHGPFSIQGGFYENYFIGIAIKDAEIQARATGHELLVEKAKTTDGEKGTSNSTAVFDFKPGLPFSVQGEIKHFRIVQFDWLTAAASGPFTIKGDLSGALAQGKLTLDEADVTIPDQLPSELPTLPLTFINEPETHVDKLNPPEPYPFRYELEIHGDHDLRLSGRGIEAELEGDIQMTGKNLSVIASGALHTKKGKFAFAGKDFIINQGEVLFSEEKGFLNITSTVEYPSLTITVHFRGDLKAPQLIFESNPSMSTSAILAHILFNKDVSELSAGQAVQLASTIITLSGTSGPNVLESIRKSLGIDRFSVSVPATKESGYVAIEIGKYITEGVMISLVQSTKTSQVKVEVQLKSGFALEAETQEDNQGKFSFKWNKNY